MVLALEAAFRGLGSELTEHGQDKMRHAAEAIGQLGDRLSAIEDILRVMALKAGISADEAVKAAAHPRGAPTQWETHIRRILG